VQRHPRFPDDGEWTCAETGGAVVCSGGDAPAGVAINVTDPRWSCGKRRRSARPPEDNERVCVDFSPDFPDGRAHGWRCGYTSEHGVTRVCERGSTEHALGEPCDPAHPCLDGLACLNGTCVPEKSDPACAFDRDCDSGVCRFGTCRELER
jgi:hypothetical protein